VVMLLEDGRVLVTARVDLAAVADLVALDALLARLFDRFPHAEGWFMAYTDDHEVAWGVLAACVDRVGTVRLGRVLQVASTQWRGDHPGGPTGPITGAISPLAVEAAVLGLPARASRRELAAGLAGPSDSEIEGLRRSVRGLRRRTAQAWRPWSSTAVAPAAAGVGAGSGG